MRHDRHGGISPRPEISFLHGGFLYLFLAAAFPLSPSSITTGTEKGPQDLAREAAARINRAATHLEREQAVSILAGLGNASEKAVAGLVLSSEPFRRLAAVRVLSSQKGGLTKLSPFLDDPSAAVRTAALDGMRISFADRYGGAGLFDIDQILPLLEDPFWPVRRAALLTLIASRSPAAAGPVLEALADPEPEVRRVVLFFMDELRGDLSSETLEKAASCLSPAEMRQFLKIGVPLSHPGNAVFFRKKARSLAGTTSGILALRAAVAAADPESCRDAEGALLPQIIGMSTASDPDARAAADMLIGWAAERSPENLADRLEEALVAGQGAPDTIVYILRGALGTKAVPVLERWIRMEIDNEIGAACLAMLETDTTSEGAAALARLIPLLDGDLLVEGVKSADFFLSRQEEGCLVNALARLLTRDCPQRAVKKAFSALCRIETLSPALTTKLIARFRKETNAPLRRSLAASLENAGRAGSKRGVIEALTSEIGTSSPAALQACSSLARICRNETETAEAAETLVAFFARPDSAEAQKAVLLSLISLGSPETDAFVAAETEKWWKENGPSRTVQLAAALKEMNGPETGRLLRSMSLAGNVPLRERALLSLLRRKDPFGLERLAEVFSAYSGSLKSTFLAEIGSCGLAEEAAFFLEKAVTEERDSLVLLSAIESLTPESAYRLRERLFELAGAGSAGDFGFSAAGFDAAEAALLALGRTGDPEILSLLKEHVARFVEEARSAECAPSDLDGLALTALGALADAGDPEAPRYLAGLLFQFARADRRRVILETWDTDSGEVVEFHTRLRSLLKKLLLYPDKVIEKTVSREVAGLEKSGDLFVMGDSAFGVVCRELMARKRCPRLQVLLAEFVFRCRPDLSPAEFRLNVILGDRAALSGEHDEAARHYGRAAFIAKYSPPAADVIRQVLGDPDYFMGYEPADSLWSEADHFRAAALRRQGREKEAAVLEDRAGRRSRFRRLSSPFDPRTLGGDSEE